MKRLLVVATLLGLVVMATPAMAETAGGTAHITGTIPAAITFTFTTPASVAVGALPVSASAGAGFGYDVSSNVPWTLDLTPTFASGLGVSGSWVTPSPGSSVAFTSGTPHTGWRSNGAGTTSFSDAFTVTNNGATPGAFDVSLAYLATTV